MDYIVIQTKQIAVIANSPEEAQQKVLNGEGATISSNLAANPRPKPQPQGIQTSGQFQRTTTGQTPKLNG